MGKSPFTSGGGTCGYTLIGSSMGAVTSAPLGTCLPHGNCEGPYGMLGLPDSCSTFFFSLLIFLPP
ncbi:MAG: hypothetical protein HXS46_04800 [Theionarchaea archaeon]|nr:hypothetical protein [Theionarchaea archaeon]